MKRKPKIVPPSDPHQRAAFDGGGMLFYVSFDTNGINRDIARQASIKASCATGCGELTHVEGTNGGQMPCGALLTRFGKTTQYFCARCDLEVKQQLFLLLSYPGLVESKNV